MAAMLVMLGLVGCVAQPTMVPARDVEVSMDQALMAQNKLGDLMMGSVEWTESEFSSLLSVLLEQNAGENNPIEDVTVWFEPNNQIVIRIQLVDELVAGVSTLDVAGTVDVQGNHVVVDVTQAGTGNLSLSESMLPAISEQINTALADPQLGVAAGVETDSGVIRLNLGM
ncbi:MAG: hypothetical protein WDZ49_03735 [Litorilinea sp.]